MRGLVVLLLALCAVPAWGQPPAEATVEHRILDYETTAVEQRFLVMPDGTRLRLKGSTEWRSGQKVRVRPDKIRKKEKASREPDLSEAEINTADVELLDVIPGTPSVTMRLTVIPIYFIGTPTPTTTVAQLTANYKLTVEAFFPPTSYNQMTVPPTVMTWVAIPQPQHEGTGCWTYEMEASARAALSAQSIPIPDYDLLQFYAPAGGAWGCSGLGGIAMGNGYRSFVFGGTGSSVHEIGHNLGFGHSSFRNCDVPGCGPTQTYGGCGVMGNRSCGRDFWASHKQSRGWITRTPITASGTYRVDFLDGISSGDKSLSIGFYTVEMQRAAQGAMVTQGTLQQDIEPFSPVEDKFINVGQVWYSPTTFSTPFSVRLMSVDTAGGMLAVTFNPTFPLRPGGITAIQKVS